MSASSISELSAPGARPATGRALSIGPGSPEPLGVSLRDDGLNVAVVSRHARRIHLCLFDAAGEAETHRLVLPERLGDVHFGFLPGAGAGLRYGLRAEGSFDPAAGHRFDASKLLVDPYALELDRPFGRGAVPKAIATPLLPEAPRPAPRAPGFIYEVNVKAFSRLNPKIPERLRGTVAGLGHPASIAHLVRLGVDTVELMPLAAWSDERHLPGLGLSNAWGYNPMVFMAPDPRLAPGGMAEIRAAVAALHDAGIQVLLDVVFNHTGESDDQGETLSLRGLDNALYYRHANGRLVNDTGCGNTLAVERAAVLRLVMDALRHWVAQAGIDGFRFDLATTLGRTGQGFTRDAPLLAAIAQDPLLRDLVRIAEPWDVGPDGYRLGSFPRPWREWNDRYRDDIRRFWRGDGGRSVLATRLAGSSDLFERPSAGINHVAAHDGFTLRDAVSHGDKHNHANGEDNRDGNAREVSWNNGTEGEPADAATGKARAGDVRALLVCLFASRGVAMLAAGDEMGRSQRGNNNAYAQDNDTTWLDWALADQGLIDFVASLARLRRQHKVFAWDRLLTGETIDESGYPDALWLGADGEPLSPQAWEEPQARVLGLVLYAEGERLCLWINGDGGEAVVPCPLPRDGFAWGLRAASAAGVLDGYDLNLAARSAAILVEEPSRLLRRSFGVEDRLIARLAGLAGIASEWWDVDGRRTETAIETKRALLAALEIAAETSSEAHASLARLQSPGLPPVHLARLGALLPPGLTPSRRLRVELETGEFLEVEPDGLHPTDLPIGTHRLVDGDSLCHLIRAPHACHLPPDIAAGARRYGLAAHLYALRHQGDAGIGDFETLGRFGEAASALGGALIGINPLHHLFPVDRSRASPYQPSDRRFIDPIYLAIEGADPVDSSGHVDYDGVWKRKREALRCAFEVRCGDPGFLVFERHCPDALRLHAQFEALSEAAGTVDWKRWTLAPRDIDPTDIAFRIWLEWTADRQLAGAARRGGLGLYRDLALGCAPDGGEVWAAPERFAKGVSIGAPPDPFSSAGQVWNLPPFNPRALRCSGLAAMREILAANMRHAAALRIDHILGYARQFWVPDGAEGKDGAYVAFPLDELIAVTAIESHRASCAIIGEDLGTVPEGLRAALDAARILSYRVLWFERDKGRFRPPATYPPLSASCISTHDLPTFLGWRRQAPAEEASLREALTEAGIAAGLDDDELMTGAHEFLASTPSALMLIQADDLSGETEPLNVPGTDRERPNWRRRLSESVESLPDLPQAKVIVAAVRKHRG